MRKGQPKTRRGGENNQTIKSPQKNTERRCAVHVPNPVLHVMQVAAFEQVSQLVSSHVSAHTPLLNMYPVLHVVHVSAAEHASQLASLQVAAAEPNKNT
jgi:hypothetical protein